ncbi:eukaryotic initiation factor [Blastocystis sp. ATCC 50177/Nand II]|uniref:Eukaryotic translation initiation factor 3 subunit E n=1 Tax=Blastocystis sp. subtype 1 (strain ATCC 50177 / NandII) TaxID=478820 RepID=A0A196SI92_BLAHN|nr:eukaryotic initiation factor [Blastocystis sp. ATCC 50177/Nand II]
MAEKEATAQQEGVAEVVKGTPNAKFDLSRRMAPYFDIHLLLPVFDWLEESKMYKQNEIAKARYALLQKTNMLEYAVDVFKSIYPEEEPPKELKSKAQISKDRYDEIMESPLIQCVQSCVEEKESEGVMPVLSDEDLQSFEITKADLEECCPIAKFLMNCGQYSMVIDLITFYLFPPFPLLTHSAQMPSPAPCKDLFASRYLSLLWGNLTCQLLMGDLEEAHAGIKAIEAFLAANESTVPALQVAQERCWLLHYGLFVLAQHEEGAELFLRTFNRKEYMAAVEIYCPWLLRYMVVLAVVQLAQNRALIGRLADVLEREQAALEDPVLLFLYQLSIEMDFEAASEQLARCEDVFASDFFLSGNPAFEAKFMQGARVLVFELMCNVHRRIGMKLLARNLSLSEEACKQWVEQAVETKAVEQKVAIQDGCVVIDKSAPSLYEQVMERTQDLKRAVEGMKRSSQ